jgi:hypothetical protein
LYTASGGNKSLADEGKKWIMAALEGIAILVFAYILLNTINPALLNINKEIINPISLPKPVSNTQTVSASSGSISQNFKINNIQASQTASTLLSFYPNYFESIGTCDVTGNPGDGSDNPLANLRDTANGIYPYVCNNTTESLGGCLYCVRGGKSGNVTLNPNMLLGLLKVAQEGYHYTVTSFTTYQHENVPHGHYSGEAVDLVVNSPSQSQYSSLRNSIQKISNTYCASGSIVICENNGSYSNVKVYQDCAYSGNTETTHIHWTCLR